MNFLKFRENLRKDTQMNIFGPTLAKKDDVNDVQYLHTV